MRINKTEKNYIKIKSLKGKTMIRKVLATSLLLFAIGYAENASVDNSDDNLKASRVEKLESALAKIIGKAGIHIGGEFRSQFLYSIVKPVGNSANSNVDSTNRSDEGVEYTSVDFEITARPHSAASGTVILRLHQDWRNFFGILKSPVSARWISMDGTVADMFNYNVGTFKQKYSPLFMWSPDAEIDFEPELFAKFRRMAMKEDFLGNNERVLEGINLNFDAEMDPVFDEWHLNVMGARLRASGVRPELGGNAVISRMQASMFDRYVLGINTDHVIIPDVSVGATFMDIWDDKNSYSGKTLTNKEQLEVLRDRTFLFGGRLGLGTAAFIDPKKINVKIGGEIAVSMDDSSFIDTSDSVLKNKQISGKAICAGVDLKVGLSGVKGALTFNGDFVLNDHTYRNEMAQSPTFIGNTRIMNVENDDAGGALYSTFDALYRNVFKFSPSLDLSNASTTNGFYKVPTRKVSYTNSIFTTDEIEADTIDLYDASFNIVMPNGPATANRMGGNVDLGIDLLNKAVLVKGDFAIYNTPEGDLDSTSLTLNKQLFMEYGGGASIDIAKLGDWWQYPFIFSGSVKGSMKTNDAVSINKKGWQDVTNMFINSGLYFTFWKRASLLAGFQVLNSNVNVAGINNIEFKQKHWGVGLEWKVSENGTLTASYGQIYLEKTIDNDANPKVVSSFANDKYNQTDLYLTVNF